MNQFDPLANPVMEQGSLSADPNATNNAAAEAVLPQRVHIFNKQVIATAGLAVLAIVLTTGVYASLSHAKQVSAQQELQRNSRVVVL